jgi:hypothetical protein
MIRIAAGRASCPKPVPEELTPTFTLCPNCQGRMPSLSWAPGLGYESEYSPDFTLYCAHLMAYIPGGNPGRVCRRCRQQAEIARLFGDWGQVVVLDPVKAELDRLRAEALPNADVKPDGLPPIGRLFATPAAVSAMARSLPASPDDFEERRKALGREALDRLLAERFGEGDWGAHGLMDQVRLTKADRARGLLASQAVQNAVAVLDGSGSVLGAFAIAEHQVGSPSWPRPVNHTYTWTELSPGQATTLCYAGGDCVRTD